MTALNGYHLTIKEGSYACLQDKNGYVYLEHNQTYSIVLRNNNSTRCDAILTIDGKDMGGFRIEAHSSITIERPANVDRKFTFYKLGTSEATSAQLAANNNLGLVSVVFKPEVVKLPTPKQDISALTKGGGFYGADYVSDLRQFGTTYSDKTTRSGAKGMSAGGTGLSEKSAQRFTTHPIREI